MEKILLVTILITLIIGIAVIIYVNKTNKNKWIESMVNGVVLKNTKLSECFSKDVVNLYIDVLNDTNKYYLTEHTLIRSDSDICIWAANDIINRKFFSRNNSNEEQVAEMNSKLTYYDKILLDKLIQSIKSRQDKLVTKFFI